MKESLFFMKGKKIIAMKGIRTDMRRKKGFGIEYILFSDKETYLSLEEQYYYEFHDCDSTARVLRCFKDKKIWSMIFNDNDKYPNADMDIDY